MWQTTIDIYLQELLRDFEVIVTGIASEGLEEKDLGNKFDLAFIEKIKKLKINKVGEGGEFETLVINCPMFKKRIEIEDAERKMETSIIGHYKVKKAILV